MIKNKFLIMATLLVMLTLLASACSVKTEKSESYTDEDGNTVTTTTTNDNGVVTTDTTSSDDEEANDEEANGEEANAEEATDIPASVQAFANNFDTLAAESDSTYVTDIENKGDGAYKINISDPSMFFILMTKDGEVMEASVTTVNTDDDIIRGCFGFFVKTLAADDVGEVVEGVLAAADGTYETGFANYIIKTDNSNESPINSLVMVRK